MNIGVDLRIVDTKTLAVVKTISLEKQITGHEVTFGIFRFFGSGLWDINMGEKSQEPLQLGVRTALEEGVVDLISAVEGTDPGPCLANKAYWVSDKSAEEILQASGVQPASTAPAPTAAVAPAAAPAAAVAAAPLPAPPAPPPAPAPAPASVAAVPPPPPAPPPAPPAAAAATPAPVQSQAQPENIREVASDGAYTVSFDFGSTDLGGQSAPEVDRIAAQAAKGGGVAITITARANENWAPVKRDEITRARIKAVVDSLTARGIPAWRISIAWMPGATDMNIVRDGSGYQRIARLAISRT
jgi:outer membrane protein OmpA-like peptidoglycan-associated protein